VKKFRAVLSSILLCLLALFFPGSSAAQSFRVGVRLANQGMQQSQSAAVPLSAFNTDFTMLPSVFGTRISPYGGGPQTLNLVLFCYTLPTGNIIPNCDITVVPSAEANSGGHLHNTNRPAGTFTPDHGNSGPSGFLPVTYTAPEASGIINVTETGSPNGFSPFGTIFTIGIEFGGLQPASVSGFIVDTQSNMHGNNNGNATPQMAAALQDTADLFADLLAQAGEKLPALHVTALSLPQGGLFDYKYEWSPPHVDHRFGFEADISPTSAPNLTDAQRGALQKAFLKSGLTAPVPGENPQDEGANHWHLRLPQ
jgi:hypothetical protein